MVASVSEQCRACITHLKNITSTLSDPSRQKYQMRLAQVNDELERFSLWVGSIGALQLPNSSMSLESRLRDANDILTHVIGLLDNMDELVQELFRLVSEEPGWEINSASQHNCENENQTDELELLEEIRASITRLFRTSSLIHQAAPTNLFAKALSQNLHQFNDQYDIAHVGEKYPKLATDGFTWLQEKLGRAITQRRHYLSYIQDHCGKLESTFTHQEITDLVAQFSTFNRLSTFFTKASSPTPSQITPRMPNAEEKLDLDDDSRSHATMYCSSDGDMQFSTIARVPKLDGLRINSDKETECPFCSRIIRFKNERMWRRHVLSDLYSYVCTFPNCDIPYFSDANTWFDHEMQNHRVVYTCRLCKNDDFPVRDYYLAHVRKQHHDVLEESGEQVLLDIARKPLDQIAAQECPCCSEWWNDLKELAGRTDIHPEASNHTLKVLPAVFKQHLASHLEQLALFAIPMGFATKYDGHSNAAVKDDIDVLSSIHDPVSEHRKTVTLFPLPPIAAEEKLSSNTIRAEEIQQSIAKGAKNKNEFENQVSQPKYFTPPMSTPIPKWNPIETLHITRRLGGSFKCSGLRNKTMSPCGWYLVGDVAKSISEALCDMSMVSPQFAIKSLERLAGISLCTHHKTQDKMKVAEWTAAIKRLVLVTQSSSDQPMHMYTSILYEHATHSKKQLEYTQRWISHNKWRCEVTYDGIHEIGEAQSKKVAKRIASQKICEKLGIKV